MRQAYSKILLKDWEHRLETFKPAFANSVRVQELTLGSVAPNLEGCFYWLRHDCRIIL